MESKVTAIAAIGSQTRALGKNNDLIWKIPADLQRFKERTKNHPVIMGRATYESLPKRPLPNRTNIVLTRKTEVPLKGDGVIVAHSPEDALTAAQVAQGSEEIFIIGGGQIYTLFLPYTKVLDLTIVHEDEPADADVYFPEYSEFTEMLHEEQHEYEGLTYTNVLLKRPETYTVLGL